MALNRAVASPFTSNILEGWDPVHPHIRYPVTLGLYQEGPNLALFIAPMNLKLLASLVPIPPTDQALVMSGAQVLDDAFLLAPDCPSLVPWSAISSLDGEVDIIHRPAGMQADPVDLVTPILAAPQRAVPAHWGSRLAIGLNDGCHATVITPHPDIIQAVLTGFVEAYAEEAMGTPIRFPDIRPDLQAKLMRPMTPGQWVELRFLPRARYWMFEFAQDGDPNKTHRWVAPSNGGHWRQGWSW